MSPAPTPTIEEALGSLFSIGVTSESRAAFLVDRLRGQPVEIFWPVFHEAWPSCDATWQWSRSIRRMLVLNGSAGQARDHMNDEDRSFVDGLPDLITIYRGCHKAHVLGVSWSTDKAVAGRFARGHRGIAVERAVIASAVIPKCAVFTVITDRDESEVVIDPRRLRQVRLAYSQPQHKERVQ